MNNLEKKLEFIDYLLAYPHLTNQEILNILEIKISILKSIREFKLDKSKINEKRC